MIIWWRSTHFRLELPHQVSFYPPELQAQAKKIVPIITAGDFPSSASHLIEAVKGNEEWEQLLHDELNWMRS